MMSVQDFLNYWSLIFRRSRPMINRALASVPGLILPAVILGVGIVLWAVIRGDKKAMSPLRLILRFAFALYFMMILDATGLTAADWLHPLVMFGGERRAISFDIFSRQFSYYMNVMNILLFVPYGMLIRPAVYIRRWSFIKAVCAGLITTCFIEFIQIFIGRYPELIDVITNTLGAAIGYILVMPFYIGRRSDARSDTK